MTPDDGVVGMAALNDLLDAHLVPAASRATLLEAVAAVQADGLTVVGRPGLGGEVELGPADGLIAAAVRSDRVRLGLDRRAAVRAVQQHEFCRIEEDGSGPARMQLALEQWAVQQHAVVVRGLVVAALRAAVSRPAPARGPARTGRTVRTGRAPKPPGRSEPAAAPVRPAVCPVHFVQLVNGHCDYCDD